MPMRHQRLPQFVAFKAAKHEDLHQHADDGEIARKPAPTPRSQMPVRVRDLVADIGAEQIERAVREVDVAHQPEHQGEAAGDQEIEAGQRDAVENRN